MLDKKLNIGSILALATLAVVKRHFCRKMTGTQLEALSVAARDTHRVVGQFAPYLLWRKQQFLNHGGLRAVSTLPLMRVSAIAG